MTRDGVARTIVILLVMCAAATRGAFAQTVDVIEFYNAVQDHYFISSLKPDIDALDSGKFPGWVRTGLVFKAYAQAGASTSPVCRFYIPPQYGDSHFFSASPAECAQTAMKFPYLVLESSTALYIDLPSPTTGACPAGDVSVYRVWDHRADSNHRYTTDRALRDQMVARGWTAEGYGPDQVIMCAAAPKAITAMSVCAPGSGTSTGCAAGTTDSMKPVLAPAARGGGSINAYGGLIGLSDEHSTILPPGTVPAHPNDYLVLAASQTALSHGEGPGLIVLSAGPGPAPDGQWTLDYAPEYGHYQPLAAAGSQNGIVLTSAMGIGNCPVVASASGQDPTFDLNYAAPGSVVIDPTNPSNLAPGAFLMIYEGTNTCIGVAGPSIANNFYSTIGLATSLGFGVTWPTYRSDWIGLPRTNATQGPRAAFGAIGSSVCMGNDCATGLPAGYGRYAVLSQPVTAAAAMTAAQPFTHDMGNSEVSAFVDDVNAAGGTYLYILTKRGTGPTDLGGFHFGATAQTSGIAIARAKLNGGTAPLQFLKWYGPQISYATGTGSGSFTQRVPAALPQDVTCGPPACPPTPDNRGMGNVGGGLDSPLFPADTSGGASSASFRTCQAAGQDQSMPSLGYFEPTHQYLLVFVCSSLSDPATGASGPGAAWFYATLDATQYDLGQQDKWSAAQEIAGSWSAFDAAAPCSATGDRRSFSGWYPSLMSLEQKPAHLATTGYVLFLKGCAGGGTGRQYSSRSFVITTD